MKFFALLPLAILAWVSSTVALRDAVCGLPHSMPGPCDNYMSAWTYVARSNECIEFMYGSCGGNNNNFRSQYECAKKCQE